MALVGVGWYAKCQIFLLIFLVIAMTSVVLGAFFPKVPDEAENAAAGESRVPPPASSFVA